MKFFKTHSVKMKNDRIIELADKFTDIGPDVFDSFAVEYLILSEKTKSIRDYAFSGTGKCHIYLPKGIDEIEPMAFENINPNTVFYCVKGSYAEEICVENQVNVETNTELIFNAVKEIKQKEEEEIRRKEAEELARQEAARKAAEEAAAKKAAEEEAKRKAAEEAAAKKAAEEAAKKKAAEEAAAKKAAEEAAKKKAAAEAAKKAAEEAAAKKKASGETATYSPETQEAASGVAAVVGAVAKKKAEEEAKGTATVTQGMSAEEQAKAKARAEFEQRIAAQKAAAEKAKAEYEKKKAQAESAKKQTASSSSGQGTSKASVPATTTTTTKPATTTTKKPATTTPQKVKIFLYDDRSGESTQYIEMADLPEAAKPHLVNGVLYIHRSYANGGTSKSVYVTSSEYSSLKNSTPSGTVGFTGSSTAKSGKNKLVAALLAFFLGGFGIHKFYMGKPGWGFIYIVVNVILAAAANFPVMSVVALVEAIIYLADSEDKFNDRCS